MELSCIRHTALPNTTKLFADFTYHPERVEQFYPYLPVSDESFRRTAAAIDFPPEKRQALVEALRVKNADNPLLERIAQPGTVAVVTGQQVGLFGGPPFAIYKALTAIRFAEHLSSIGIPAVPVFWMATEDHDLHEVDHTWFFNANHQPVLLQATGSAVPDQPVGTVPFDQVPLDELRRVLHGLPYAEEALDFARDTYQPGRTMGDAFSLLLDRMLTGLPILHVDPMLPEFRKLAAPLLREAVLRAPELTRDVLARNKELTAAGYHTQVHVEDSTSFVFLLDKGRRQALKRRNGEYAALADRAEDLSPNALLRPVVQDSMIPTIAYVGGPAEIAYLAQSEVLYRELLGRQPIALHRASFTIITPREHKRLDRFNLELTDFFHGEQSVAEKAAKKLVDPRIAGRVSDARGAATQSLARMFDAVEHFDPSIRKAIEKSRRKIEYQFEKIDRRVGREAITREKDAATDVDELYNTVFPRHKLQERVYSSLAFVAQYGPDFARRVYDNLLLDCPDHRVLTL